MCKYSIWVSRQIFYSSLDSFMISVISDTLLSVYFKVETVLQLLLLNSTPSNVWVKHSENTNKPLNPNESLNNTPTCFKGSNFLPSCTLGEPWNYYLLVSCRGSLNYKQDSCGNLSKAEWSAALRCSFYYWGSLLPAWRKISVEAPGWGQCVDNIFEVSVRTRKECGDSLNLVSCGWKCTELRGKSNWLFFFFFFLSPDWWITWRNKVGTEVFSTGNYQLNHQLKGGSLPLVSSEEWIMWFSSLKSHTAIKTSHYRKFFLVSFSSLNRLQTYEICS